MNGLRQIGIFLLLAMFVGSGLQKIVKLGNIQTKQFTELMKLPLSVARMLVFAAGLLEVASVILIVYGEQKKDKKLARNGVLGLILFTILVTLVFKVYPKFKMIQFFSNMAILGGLILFYECLK